MDEQRADTVDEIMCLVRRYADDYESWGVLSDERHPELIAAITALVRERDRMRVTWRQTRSLAEAARRIPVAPTWAGVGTLMYLDASVARLVNEAVRTFDAATAPPDGGEST